MTASAVPPPPIPADCNLTDFGFMPIDINRLLDSSFNSTTNDGAWRAGVTLWLKSWHQKPAGSLPDNDVDLTRLSGLGRDVKTWKKVKCDAMHGWAKADDGLLYHKVVAEKVLEAWIEKLGQRLSSGAGNAKQWGSEFDPAPVDAQIKQAMALLDALNPNSKTIQKMKRRKARSGANRSPDGTPVGKPDGYSSGTPDDGPTGSQETGTGTEKGLGESISNETLSPAHARSGKESDFAKFKALYPRPDGLTAAKHEWSAALVAGADPVEIIDGLKRAVRRWTEDGTLERDKGRWLPTAATWLDETRWTDPISDAFAAGGAYPQWLGPEAIREAVLLERDDGFAKSYLDTAEWEPQSTIIARTDYAAEKLRSVSRLKSYRIITKPKSAEAA